MRKRGARNEREEGGGLGVGQRQRQRPGYKSNDDFGRGLTGEGSPLGQSLLDSHAGLLRVLPQQEGGREGGIGNADGDAECRV